ncbi:MAG: Fe-S cluster assembly protein SufD [Pseudomonadota bacterium]
MDNLTPYLEAMAAQPGDTVGWLAEQRHAALNRFKVQGWPSKKLEAWRYADLRPLARTSFVGRDDHVDEQYAHDLVAGLPAQRGDRLVFVAGQLMPALSSLGGTAVRALSSALADNPDRLKDRLVTGPSAPSSIADLNAALMREGVVIDVAPTDSPEPIEIVHIAVPGVAPSGAHIRHLFRLAPDTTATIRERFLGEGDHWLNLVMQCELGKSSTLDLVSETRREGGIQTWEGEVTLGADARFNHFVLHAGGASLRTALTVNVEGEGAHAELAGVQLGRGTDVHDIRTQLNHKVLGATSNQSFKAVVDDRAASSFQGKVVVARDAQKTDAQQSSRNLLLKRTAEANTKPELEIYADDVQCAHGATVGELDKDALFYLMSRGLTPTAARSLLIEAFVADVIDEITDEHVRAQITDVAANWMHAALEGGER